MRKLFRPLKWLWVALLLGGVALPLMSDCLRGLILGQGCAPWRPALSFMSAYGLWVGLILLALALLTFLARQDDRRYQTCEEDREQSREARKRFDLLKPTKDLRPEDLGFQVLEAGEPLIQDRRPFYEFAYVSRVAVPYERRADRNPQPRFEEEALVRSLREGKGFVLLGPPLDGKSRTLFDVVKRMDEYEILIPKKDEKVPDETDFSLLLEDHQIVLLLDDLTQYVASYTDLQDLGKRLSNHARTWVVACTCRDGAELRAVKDGSTSLRRFYDDIPRKLSLYPLDPDEKEQLAKSIGREWNDWASDHYPTPGSITMEGSMRYMRERFHDLSDKYPEQRDALRALKLLSAGGILPLSRHRLKAVLEHVFERRLHLDDCLNTLTNQAFLQPGGHDPVEPEPAYLEYVVTYTEGKEPQDDFVRLAIVLENLKDHEGLVRLNVTMDVEVLRELEGEDHGFSKSELEELRPLLGLYGSDIEKRLPPGKWADIEYIGKRQQYWQIERSEAPHGTARYAAADRAYKRYGLILDEFLNARSDIVQ